MSRSEPAGRADAMKTGRAHAAYHQQGSAGNAPPWHTGPVHDVLERLGSSPEGLASQEARARLQGYGPNRLRSFRATPAWLILVEQFRSLVVLVLFIAATVALTMGAPLEAAAIAAVLVINAALGFFTELRARRAMEGLLRLDVSTARVVRDGREVEIPGVDVVPGDVIVIEAGDALPADARLIEQGELRTDESALTGESVPVSKEANAPLDALTPIAERSTMLYKGTIAVTGSGRAVVVETGIRTEVGRIGELVGGIALERTPLEKRLDALGRRLIWLTFGVTAVVVVTGLLRGFDLVQMIETGVALAIAAVPEGLPAVATIALSVGLRRMAVRHALIRRLPAVEALGSVTVICTDKTGTLTAGAMTVTELWASDAPIRVSGVGYAPLGGFEPAELGEVALEALRAAVLTSHGGIEQRDAQWVALGDPTDAALITVARKAGLDQDQLHAQWRTERRIPFTSGRMWTAAFVVAPNDDRVAYVKGAPEAVLAHCDRIDRGEGEVALDGPARAALLGVNHEMADRGLRVIGLARGDPAGAELGNLVFLAFAGMIDPPAEGVADTIDAFRKAGIRTAMLTGDQQRTGVAVARRLRLLEPDQATLGGREIADMPDDLLAERVRGTTVFTRIGPEDKLRIIDALQRSGQIVAMLGDGVNDAAALRKADIGVAMGRRGTDIAKDAADVILRDDRFPTIGAAIEEGRVIFDNIRKFVFYLFSCNLAEVLLLFTAGVLGWPLPLLPLQILWLNLVTDTLPALALALEPAEPGIMERPPRDPQQAILSGRALSRIALYAGIITAVSLTAFRWGLGDGVADRALIDPRATTYAFMTIALAQIFHLGNARSRTAVVAPNRIIGNPWALAAVAAGIALQLAAVYVPPLAELLQVVRLTPTDWIVIATFAATPAVLGQLVKIIGAYTAGRDSHLK